jgi:hypothetical protein
VDEHAGDEMELEAAIAGARGIEPPEEAGEAGPEAAHSPKEKGPKRNCRWLPLRWPEGVRSEA